MLAQLFEKAADQQEQTAFVCRANNARGLFREMNRLVPSLRLDKALDFAQPPQDFGTAPLPGAIDDLLEKPSELAAHSATSAFGPFVTTSNDVVRRRVGHANRRIRRAEGIPPEARAQRAASAKSHECGLQAGQRPG
jgi:hypothetical protein